MEKYKRFINVTLTVELPVEHAYTDSELIEVLILKSDYNEIKFLDAEVIEEVEELPKLNVVQIDSGDLSKPLLELLKTKIAFIESNPKYSTDAEFFILQTSINELVDTCKKNSRGWAD